MTKKRNSLGRTHKYFKFASCPREAGIGPENLLYSKYLDNGTRTMEFRGMKRGIDENLTEIVTW